MQDSKFERLVKELFDQLYDANDHYTHESGYGRKTIALKDHLIKTVQDIFMQEAENYSICPECDIVVPFKFDDYDRDVIKCPKCNEYFVLLADK